MACPPGQHQHTGKDGRMLRCHSISEQHKNPATQQAHQAALASMSQRGSGYSKRDVSPMPTAQRRTAPPPKPKASNIAGEVFGSSVDSRIASYKERFRRGPKGTPGRAVWYGMLQIARIYDWYKNHQSDKRLRNVTQGYADGWVAIDQMLDSFNTYDESDPESKGTKERPSESALTAKQMYDLRQKVYDKFVAIDKDPQSDNPTTVQYGEKKVYADYIRYIEQLMRQEGARAQFAALRTGMRTKRQ